MEASAKPKDLRDESPCMMSTGAKGLYVRNQKPKTKKTKRRKSRRNTNTNANTAGTAINRAMQCDAKGVATYLQRENGWILAGVMGYGQAMRDRYERELGCEVMGLWVRCMSEYDGCGERLDGRGGVVDEVRGGCIIMDICSSSKCDGVL